MRLLIGGWLVSGVSVAACFLAGCTGPGVARERSATSDVLGIESMFQAEFRPASFGPARWLDGSGFATREPAASGPGQDLVRYDAATGKRSVILAARDLVPAGRRTPLELVDYQFSGDGKRVLIFTNTRRVWRYHTRGDYWVFDIAAKRLRRLGRSLDPSRLQFAKFSPDGTRVGYVYRNDLFVESLADGAITRLTTDGSETLSNGTFDWVYEEEWGLRDGFRWSPDGTRIAFWQIDAAAVGTFHLVDNTAGVYPRLTPIRYPKVGTTNPSARLGVVAAGGGAVRFMTGLGDPRENYLARMRWSPRGDALVVQQLNRLQNRNALQVVTTETGQVRTAFVDQDLAWVDPVDDFRFLDDGRRFLWVSERDGWRHVYAVGFEPGAAEETLITPGAYDVTQIVHVDVAGGGWIYFLASPENATQRFLYRASLSDPGPPERLTPVDRGTHSYQVAPDGRFAIHTRSSFGEPPAVSVVTLPGHRTLRTLVDNGDLRRNLAQAGFGTHEFFRVEIEPGVELDGWVMKPPGFDPSRRYPTIVHVYGEPAGQTVLDRYGAAHAGWHRLLAQRGYVVLSIDNRGTPAPRGRAWRKCVYRKIGILAPKDQAAALVALQQRWPWLDRERVGVWGWSGGGSMTLNALFRYPDLYHTGIAVAFVANQRFYDTIYQERYMGLPQDNAEGYRDGSPISHAENLQGNLLLIYGTGDDNCHYQNCEVLVDRLIACDKDFSMLAYPNRTHAIREGPNTRKHLFRAMTRYFLDHLPPGPRPQAAGN